MILYLTGNTQSEKINVSPDGPFGKSIAEIGFSAAGAAKLSIVCYFQNLQDVSTGEGGTAVLRFTEIGITNPTGLNVATVTDTYRCFVSKIPPNCEFIQFFTTEATGVTQINCDFRGTS